MDEKGCICQKVPELNYVSSNPDCPVHYSKIDQEQKWIEEFEEVWQKAEVWKLYKEEIMVGSVKPVAKWFFLESRRRLKMDKFEELMLTNELNKILEEMKKEGISKSVIVEVVDNVFG